MASKETGKVYSKKELKAAFEEMVSVMSLQEEGGKPIQASGDFEGLKGQIVEAVDQITEEDEFTDSTADIIEWAIGQEEALEEEPPKETTEEEEPPLKKVKEAAKEKKETVKKKPVPPVNPNPKWQTAIRLVVANPGITAEELMAKMQAEPCGALNLKSSEVYVREVGFTLDCAGKK